MVDILSSPIEVALNTLESILTDFSFINRSHSSTFSDIERKIPYFDHYIT